MNLRPRAISRDEFIRAFRLCKPPIPWPETIAIGNSGGPDSMSLLFLFRRYLAENSHVPNIPRRVVSLHVDHGLQSASADMAEQCAKIANRLGVEHIYGKIPWSQEKFPEFPSAGTIESKAREARFRVLFQNMTKANSRVLALAHHADDQVETSLMRILKGSTVDGAAGMTPCRRWGMDSGVEGMRRWIIRPLLTFPKDRLLATCDANNLPYVTDPTNFQPEITLRNAIRHWLANDGKQNESSRSLFDVDNLKTKLDALQLGIDLSTGPAAIYSAVNNLAHQADDIQDEVDFTLSRNALHSPPGTYIITHNTLASIENPKVQRAIILRLLRYASFRPWGSVSAQAKRRTDSITRIIKNLWGGNPFRANIKPFCAGGGVNWTPVILTNDEEGGKYRFRFANKTLDLKGTESFGWLASRQIPPSHETITEQGYIDPLRVNITSQVEATLQAAEVSPHTPLEVLYDHRFVVTLNLAAIPPKLKEALLQKRVEMWLLPNTRWLWPQVVIKPPGASSSSSAEIGRDSMILHNVAQAPDRLYVFPKVNTPDAVGRWKKIIWRPGKADVVAPWIEISFERPLTRF